MTNDEMTKIIAATELKPAVGEISFASGLFARCFVVWADIRLLDFTFHHPQTSTDMKRQLLFPLFLFIHFLSIAQPPVVNGWTVFTPSADSRIIYVSTLSGNDATALTYLPSSAAVGGNVFQPIGPIRPYATLAAATALLRPGFPDYLLLRSGETWTGQSFGALSISGRNNDEPMVIGSYGTGERPRILTGNQPGLVLIGADCSHLALVDLYLRPHTLGLGDSPSGFFTTSPFDGILLENCVITAFPSAVAAHTDGSGSRRNLRIRRCQFTDNAAYGVIASQPIFLDNINGILMEECLLDHNGWNLDIGSLPTTFKHNSYFQVGNSNVVFRKNIVARASATGVGMRCGGLVQDNLILENVNNLQFGTHETTIDWPSQSVTGEITGNVIIGARNEGFDPGRAIFIAKARGVLVRHNIVKDYEPMAMSQAIIASDGYADLTIDQNIVYNWCPNIPFGPGTFFETNNGIALYAGGTGMSSITGNHIQQHNPGGGCVHSMTFSDKTFRNNCYFNPTPSNSFQSGGISYTAWLSLSGETGSMYMAKTYPDPDRNVATYMAQIGALGGLPEFLAAARTLSKTNWNRDYTARPVIEHVQKGFGLFTTSVGDPTPGPEQNLPKNQVSIFPNPTSGEVVLRSERAIAGVVVYDGTGRTVLREHCFSGEKLDLGGLPAGLYWVAVSFAEGGAAVGVKVAKE